MLRKITILILLILTVVQFTSSDSIQSAREFIQNNIYVWSETQEGKTSDLLCRYAEKTDSTNL